MDDWLCAPGNADVSPPNRAGKPVTDKQQRTLCAELERARLSYQTDNYDWDRLLRGAFGAASCDRMRGIYGDAITRYKDFDPEAPRLFGPRPSTLPHDN